MKQIFTKKDMEDYSLIDKLQGEVHIVKGYGNDQAAALFGIKRS